jgi:hypothetical protein
MNWKGFRGGCGLFEVLSQCTPAGLEGWGKKSIRTVNAMDQIQIGNITNTIQKCYCLHQLDELHYFMVKK